MTATRSAIPLALSALLLVLVRPAAASPPVDHGTALTIEAPHRFSAGSPVWVRGQLVANFALPLVVEISQPLRGQQIEIFVDDLLRATATTNNEGFYQAGVLLGTGLPLTHQIHAVAFRDTPAETRSPTVATTIDRVLISLDVQGPSSVTVGTTARLIAYGEWSDGRAEDVSEHAEWTSSDESVATVSNTAGERGLVRPTAPGTTNVSATAHGITAVMTVMVG